VSREKAQRALAFSATRSIVRHIKVLSITNLHQAVKVALLYEGEQWNNA
jgi:hypothetical protein